MYLAFNDLVTLFSDYKGVREADHLYFTVTDNAACSAAKRSVYTVK